MLDLLSLFAYVIGCGFLAYIFFNAVGFLFSALKRFSASTEFSATLQTTSKSTPNMLVSLDKQLHELDFQVVPYKLGEFDTGAIQSLVDNTIVGKYEFVKEVDSGGVYSVSINNKNYGSFNNEYNVNEEHNIVGVPDSISKLLLNEFLSIAGRQVVENDHSYFKDNGVKPAEGILLANKKLVIEHNHVGDEKLDSGRTFRVAKNDVLIPISTIDGQFLSYQVVNKSQAKNIRVASSIKGGVFIIGDFPSLTNEYILCEDYLSGGTLNRATDKTVLVCFDVQNMADVAKAILFKNPNSKLIFATAKDSLTKNQSRIKRALLYANQFDMPFIFPVFPKGKKNEQYKNWNELQNFSSDLEMKEMITAQIDYFNTYGKVVSIQGVEKKFNVVYD